VSPAWTTVLLVGVATVALKAVGPMLLGGHQLPPQALGATRLLAPALLAALVITHARPPPGPTARRWTSVAWAWLRRSSPCCSELPCWW
jgi:hypothetical protein